MARKDRKVRKKMGSRTCGHGSHKKNRAGGGRGGVGKAGTSKGKWTYITAYDKSYFGRPKGFTLPMQKSYAAINVGELDEMTEKLLKTGMAKKKSGKIEIDVAKLDFEKVLGRGRVTRPLRVKAAVFTESAKKKLAEANGEAILLE